MKKNFIKVLFMTVSALLCSQIWAQDAEEIISETARLAETSYTITVKVGNKTQKIKFGLSTENGATRISSGFQPSQGYTAFFVGDNNIYYQYDYDNKNAVNIWKESKNSEKDKLKKIYNRVLYQNAVFSADDGQNFLVDTGYVELDTSDLDIISGNSKFIRSANNGFEDLRVYNKTKGVFVYAVKDEKTSKVYVICFRDKKNVSEIKPDEISEKTFYDNYINWLKKTPENKNIDSNASVYKMLSQLVYGSLYTTEVKSNGRFNNLYDNDYNMVVRKYLQLAMENNRNVFYSSLENDTNPIKSEQLVTISESEGKKIANSAKKYLNHSVKTQKNVLQSLLDAIRNWLSDNPNKQSVDYFDQEQIEGEPLPYLVDGFDTPESYNNKLIKNNTAKGGCDDIGFLNGILYNSNTETFVPLQSLKEIYKDYFTSISKGKTFDSKGKLLTLRDLNKISLVVSDLTEARIGDIIVFDDLITKKDGTKVAGKSDKKKIAVIVEDINCNKEFGTNQKQSLGNITVVWMNEDKGAERTQLSEIWKAGDDFEVPAYTEIRRVLKKGKNSSQNNNWNIYDNNLSDASIEICWMREENQKSGEQYRWIPNTGEYLYLEKLRVSAFNQVGAPIHGKNWKVKLTGAKDRNWKTDNEEGNIYNNSDCTFKIQIGQKTGTLKKNNDDKSHYDIIWDNVKNDNEISFIIDGQDNLLYYYNYSMPYGVKLPVEIKIRPESSEAARPGDDLLLEFTLSGINATKTLTLTSPEKNYIAVYDKKMLWRANLYLDKPENSLSGMDWNDAHPWNAPNSETYNNNVWFGKNEWNLPDDGYDGIAGGQIIKLPGTKWYYGNSLSQGTDNKRNFNINAQYTVLNAVAYDYQGWDSPNSYKNKLDIQKNLIKWYSETGERFGTRVDKWPESCDSFDVKQYIKYLGEELVGSETDLEKLKELYNKNKSNQWDGELNTKDYNKYVFSSNYGKLESPYNTHGLSPQFINGTVLKAKDSEAAYIPGLSNSIMYKNSTYPGGEISGYTAGTDCNGLIQSAISYVSNSYVALGTNIVKPVFWQESNNNTSTMYRLVNGYTDGDKYKTFSEEDTLTAYKIMSSSDKNALKDIKGNKVLDSKNNEVKKYQKFKYLIPGDIIVYYTDNGSPSHVMMVSSIIDGKTLYDNSEVELFWDDGSSVKILESVYNSGNSNLSVPALFWCGKSRNLDDLNKLSKKWEIWRLRK